MKKALPLLTLLLHLIPNAAPAHDLAPAIKDGTLWTTPIHHQPAFANERFTWVEENTQLRIPTPRFTLCTLTPGETLIELNQGKITRLRTTLYNRADNAPIPRKTFLQDLARHRATLDTTLSTPSTEYKSPAAKSLVKTQGYTWTPPHAALLLEYSINPATQTPEFARLSIAPPGHLPTLLTTKETTRRKRPAEYKTNVRTTPDGTTLITPIPMEDQGQKGYCAAATLARILRYYGNTNTDQHQLAQIAGTDPQTGTNPQIMFEAIAKILPAKFNLKNTLLENTPQRKILQDYNQTARRHKKTPLPTTPPPPNPWAHYDPDLLLKARATPEATTRLLRHITTHIDKGTPLIWSVILGIYPEHDGGENQRTPKPSGHMRIITGYNRAKKEITYTDSWGAGHEQKTIPLPHATAITTQLNAITP
ncbi:MAG: hypothetical protein LBD14_00145 [Puniceicoccales bacterium]|jgi:hypothetical protein|nr:hypothetical protein [Puniceicoccales bacterium]